jgi:hypothetical protein
MIETLLLAVTLLQPLEIQNVKLTGYCAEPPCVSPKWADGKTATGTPARREFVQQIGIPLNQAWYLMYLDMDDVGWKIMGIQISSVEYILTYSLTLPKRDEIGVCDITLFD